MDKKYGAPWQVAMGEGERLALNPVDSSRFFPILSMLKACLISNETVAQLTFKSCSVCMLSFFRRIWVRRNTYEH